MSATTQRTYTKAQKKQARKIIYDTAKRYKKELEEEYLQNPGPVAKLHTLFPVAIMKADFRMSLEIHRRLQNLDNQALDLLVFDKKDKYTSENVRVGCANVNLNNKNRKTLLKWAMECDAKFGYWKLSE